MSEELGAVSAKVDMCITRTEVAVAHAERASHQMDNVALLLQRQLRATERLSNHVLSLSVGMPPTWRGRFALIGASAAVGALVACALVACTR